MFDITILHPTSRVGPYPSMPHGWKDAAQAWLENCSDPSRLQYILGAHESLADKLDKDLGFHDARSFCPWYNAWGEFLVKYHTGPACQVTNLNNCAQNAKGQILVCIADDLYPPKNWDKLILEAIPEPTSHVVLHTATGSPQDEGLINVPILTYSRYQEFGYIFHPTYESMYADNEFTEVAYRDGVVVKNFNIVFDHRHPVLNRGEVDEEYGKQNKASRYREGLSNLGYRRLHGFPLESQKLVPAKRERVLALCLPGERFSSDYVAALVRLVGHVLHKGYTIVPIFVYSSNVYRTRSEIVDLALGVWPPPDFALWLDDDNTLTPEQFDMLMEDLEKNEDVAAVAGWTWCGLDNRVMERAYISFGYFEGETQVERGYTVLEEAKKAGKNLVPVDYSGFPVVLMRFSVILRLGKKAFYPWLKSSGEFGSEDTAFWKRAKDVGLKLVVDRRVYVPHFKLQECKPPQEKINERNIQDS